jgi:anti-sigma factor RsiW
MTEPPLPTPRVVAGLSCLDVLAHLSDWVDGELDAPTVTAIQAHLAGCDVCTRFGGAFAATVMAAKARLGAGSDLDAH